MAGGNLLDTLNVERWKRLSFLQIASIAPFADKVILVDSQKLLDLASIVAQLYKLENNQCCLCCALLPATTVSCFTHGLCTFSQGLGQLIKFRPSRFV